MAYNTKSIITDKDGNPISQYYNEKLDEYEAVEGRHGANKVIIYNSDGTENTELSLLPILDKLSQLTGTVIDEETRKSNELQRIEFYNQLQKMLNDGELKGDKGDKGDIGLGLEFDWEDTKLGVKIENEDEFIYVDLKGEKGDAGSIDNLDKGHIEEALGYTPVNEDELMIGGRNYLTQEEQNRIAKYSDVITTDTTLVDGLYQHKIVALTDVTIRAAIPEYDYDKFFHEDDKLVVSCDIKATEELSIKLDYSTTQEYVRVPADRWFRVHSKIKYGDRIGIYSEDRASEGTIILLKNYKLEKGKVATDWTPTLEDNDTNVDDVIDKHNTDDKAHEDIISKLPKYEEGVFKPTIVGLEVAGKNNYDAQSGFYTRLGNRVFIDLTVTLSTKDDNMKGLAVISGLPFISSENGNLRPSVSLGEVHFINLPSGAWQISGRVQPNTSWITLTTFRSGASGGAITANDVNDKTSIRLSGCYVID